MDLIDDLTKFVKSPDAHAVRYLAVGGVAVDVLGFLRMTEDLDLLIERSERSAERILRILHEFGFSGESSKADLLDSNPAPMLARPLHRFDLLTSISGRDFADCWPRHTDEALEGRDVPRLALEELVITKCADRHPPRLADIDEFERRTW